MTIDQAVILYAAAGAGYGTWAVFGDDRDRAAALARRLTARPARHLPEDAVQPLINAVTFLALWSTVVAWPVFMPAAQWRAWRRPAAGA